MTIPKKAYLEKYSLHLEYKSKIFPKKFKISLNFSFLRYIQQSRVRHNVVKIEEKYYIFMKNKQKEHEREMKCFSF